MPPEAKNYATLPSKQACAQNCVRPPLTSRHQVLRRIAVGAPGHMASSMLGPPPVVAQVPLPLLRGVGSTGESGS